MILDALGDQDIVIKLIVQGADGLNIIIGVDENVVSSQKLAHN